MRLKEFLKEAFEEFKKVDWPDRQKTGKMVMIVVIFSLSIAMFLGFFDFLFFSLIARLYSFDISNFRPVISAIFKL